MPLKLAAGRKRIWRSLEKIKAVVLASPVEGMFSQSLAVLALGEAVSEICQVPCAAIEAFPVMAM